MNKILTPNPVEPEIFYTFIESCDQRQPRHSTMEQVEAEVKKLAFENPHKTFIILQAVEYCSVKQQLQVTQAGRKHPVGFSAAVLKDGERFFDQPK